MNIATFGPDGNIHLVAMWYGFIDGKPAFETFTKSQKILNLKRDNRITVLVEDGDEYDELRGVEIVGTAEVTEDPDVVMPVARSVVDRYFGVENPDDLDAVAAGLAHKRSAVGGTY
jgi:PPOX class probable F420-dependent enzyme